MTHTVRIDGWHPAKLNELLAVHWAKRGRWKLADAMRLKVACRKVPKATGKRQLRLTWILGPRNKVKPDQDNLWKSLNDGLVQCGMLVDDSPAYLEVLPVVWARGKDKGVILELTDLPEAA